MAGAIADADPLSVHELRHMYEELGLRTDGDAYREESRWSRRWMKERFDGGAFSKKRDDIIARGSAQQ
jgi:hypothetical protein